ncbi:MAG: MoaD/ThiS family protein [Alphaproteobacteria bacterium]|nr:MoaD/ThiS family protein [Alphaproteobacteria bacterium]
MAEVIFTANIQRFVECPHAYSDGHDVRTVLDDIFRENPRARSYILDDQGALRKHIAVFVNGRLVRDRTTLSERVPQDSRVYVMQALSGG